MASLGVIAVMKDQSNRHLAAKNQELRIANQRAERRVKLATQAIENFSTAVRENPELTDQPSMEPLRKRLLQAPLEFYRQLQADVEESRDTRPETQAALAKAIVGLAWITAQIDSQANADKAYQQAIGLLHSLVRNDPQDVDHRALLGKVLGELGMLQRASGSFDGAWTSLNRARAIQEGLNRDDPAAIGYRFDLARTLDRLGLLVFTSKPDEARRCFEQAIASLQRLISGDLGSAAARADLALTYNHLGMLHRATGHPREAESSFKQAIEILDAVTEECPDEPVHRMNLAASHYNLGNVRMTRTCFERARAIQEALVRDHPAVVSYRAALARSCGNLGVIQRTAGQWDEARRSFEQVRNLLEELVRENPNVLRFRHDLALTEINLGAWEGDFGCPDEALSRYGRARSLLEDLVRRRPESAEEREALVVTCLSLGDVLNRLGRDRDALEVYQVASGHERSVFGGGPWSGLNRGLLIASYQKLAGAHRKLGQPAEAVSAMQELRTFWTGNPGELYDIARELARCASLVRGGKIGCPSDQKVAFHTYAGQATDALRQAIQSGFRDAERMRMDPDLGSLHRRADFRELLGDLVFPVDPFVR
jgi:tetratricopeptide (TPR) repeat protein